MSFSDNPGWLLQEVNKNKIRATIERRTGSFFIPSKYFDHGCTIKKEGSRNCLLCFTIFLLQSILSIQDFAQDSTYHQLFEGRSGVEESGSNCSLVPRTWLRYCKQQTVWAFRMQGMHSKLLAQHPILRGQRNDVLP